MIYSEDSFLNPKSKKIERSYQVLESMRRLNGGYIASPNPGKPDGTGRYNLFWLRDIMYSTYANEYLGNFTKLLESYELVMSIMQKYNHKIKQAIRKKPEQWALHARFHPNTFEEITEDWGHHQLDVFGLFLYKTGDLLKKGFNVLKSHEERDLINNIIQYLFTYRWETEPDFGMWEEGPELHSSSIGAVLAGLTMWFDDGYYWYKYPHKKDLSDIVPVSERYFDFGPDALKKILPRESKTRECDLAQLSLIWPYNIVDKNMKMTILKNVESSLVRDKGVIRYKGDWYFNGDEKNLVGNEAQWPLGIAWLSICYNKLIEFTDNLSESLEYLRKSKAYLQKLHTLCVDGKIPELYTRGKPNENTPLAWAHSFQIVALQSFINSAERIRTKYKTDIPEDF